jgi:hypothetical protein
MVDGRLKYPCAVAILRNPAVELPFVIGASTQSGSVAHAFSAGMLPRRHKLSRG